MLTRYYEPTLGRFDTRDLLFGDPADPTSLNLSVYAGNAPVTFTDPTGMLLMAGGGGGCRSRACEQKLAEASEKIIADHPEVYGTIWETPVEWSASGWHVKLAPPKTSVLTVIQKVVDVISSLPARGSMKTAPSYNETFQGVDVSESSRFPASTTGKVEFHGTQWGSVVWGHTIYDVGSGDVSVIGVLYTVTTNKGREFNFETQAPGHRPESWLSRPDSKYEREWFASRVIPGSAGVPVILETRLIETTQAPTGLSTEVVLVERQVFFPPIGG
jgi:hypothetical protein